MPINSIRVASTNNGFDFSTGVIKVTKYRIDLEVEKIKKGQKLIQNEKYIIDLEEYDGFAMIKYYPRHLKNDKNKFRCRGYGKPSNALKYFVPRKEMLKIMNECAFLMKEYLKEKKFRFVGFIGMVDNIDNASNKINSQRYSIYTPFVYFKKNNLTLSLLLKQKKRPTISDESFV